MQYLLDFKDSVPLTSILIKHTTSPNFRIPSSLFFVNPIWKILSFFSCLLSLFLFRFFKCLQQHHPNICLRPRTPLAPPSFLRGHYAQVTQVFEHRAAEGREFNSGGTNTQSLKITKKKVLPL